MALTFSTSPGREPKDRRLKTCRIFCSSVRGDEARLRSKSFLFRAAASTRGEFTAKESRPHSTTRTPQTCADDTRSFNMVIYSLCFREPLPLLQWRYNPPHAKQFRFSERIHTPFFTTETRRTQRCTENLSVSVNLRDLRV